MTKHFVLLYLFSFLIYAQKGDEKTTTRLDTVVLKNRPITADSLMQLVRENWIKNHDVTGYELDFEYTEDQRVISDNAIILQKKTIGVSKKEIEATNTKLETVSVHFHKNPYRVYKTSKGQVVLMDNYVPKIHVEKAVNYKPIKDFSTEDEIIEMGWEALGKEIDSTSVYKIKSGWFTVSKNTSLIRDTARTREVTLKDGRKTTYTRNYRNNIGFQLKKLITGKENIENAISSWDFIDSENKYIYKITDYIKSDSINYYLVQFTPDSRESKFAGVIKVDAHDYAVLEMNYGYPKGKNGQKLNLKWLLGVKFNENVYESKVTFERTDFGKYYPTLIEQFAKSEMYVNRPFQFIKNNTKDKRKFNLKANAVIQQYYQVRITEIKSFDQEIKGIQLSGQENYTIKELRN